jgi:hypothetical protein
LHIEKIFYIIKKILGQVKALKLLIINIFRADHPLDDCRVWIIGGKLINQIF